MSSVWKNASMEKEKNVVIGEMLPKWHWSSCVNAYNLRIYYYGTTRMHFDKMYGLYRSVGNENLLLQWSIL